MVGWHHQYNDVLPADGSTLLLGTSGGYAALPNVSWNQQSPNYHGSAGLLEPGFNSACQSPNAKVVSTLCPLTQYTSGGPQGRIEQQTFDRYVAGSTLTYLFQGLGHHVMKTGFSVEYTTWDHIKAHAGGANILGRARRGGARRRLSEHFGVLTGPDNPSSLEPFHVKTQSIIAGGFVQDSWSVMDKFTVNAGMRYDVQSLYGANGQLGLTMPNEWSPRLGVIYDPTQEGHSKIFGNFARYYENVPLGIADASLDGRAGASWRRTTTPTAADRRGSQGSVLPEQRRPRRRRRERQPGLQRLSQKWGHVRRRARPRSDPDTSSPPRRTRSSSVAVSTSSSRTARIGATYTQPMAAHQLDRGHEPRRPADVLHRQPGIWHRRRLPEGATRLRRHDALLHEDVRRRLAHERELHDLVPAREHRRPLQRERRARPEPQRRLRHEADHDQLSMVPLPGDHTHDIKIFGAKDWKLVNEGEAASRPASPSEPSRAAPSTSSAPTSEYGGQGIYESP